MKNSRNIENSLDGGEISAAMSGKWGRMGWRALGNETMLFKIEKRETFFKISQTAASIDVAYGVLRVGEN